MKKILLVYLPFCTPATPPYSITAMQGFLQANTSERIDVLDLNLEFHMLKFPEFHKYCMNSVKNYSQETKNYLKISAQTYSYNNSQVVEGNKPELFEELLEKITVEKPDIVAFSIVYSSQAFYARSMLQSLKKLNIVSVIGGPAINSKLIELADHTFNEIEFLEFINKVDKKITWFPDFSIWKKEYFTPYPVIPLKTTSTCFYRGCAYCSHFSHTPYEEYDLDMLKKAIIKSGKKHFFLIDDMISRQRLLQFAEMIKPLGCYWTCQLRPTKDYDFNTLKTLYESGLLMIMWGVESASERILKLINKGTNPNDISVVLKNSYDAGISNVAYILFGFPTETQEEFMDTISFLEENGEYIDLVSPSVFGLQRNTPIYKNPKKYGITNIIEEERTALEPKITYEISSGLTKLESVQLKKENKKRIEAINKYPKSMNFFREHMLCRLSDERGKHS
ncbi:MAG: radical SAM protein [Nanoarchaeota archaeon]|nr:radical SAM protein [Nanoarchaeota archaeon]